MSELEDARRMNDEALGDIHALVRAILGDKAPVYIDNDAINKAVNTAKFNKAFTDILREERDDLRGLLIESQKTNAEIVRIGHNRQQVLEESINLLTELWTAWKEHHGVCEPQDNCIECNELRGLYSRIIAFTQTGQSDESKTGNPS